MTDDLYAIEGEAEFRQAQDYRFYSRDLLDGAVGRWTCPYCGREWSANYETSPLCCGEVHCERIECKPTTTPAANNGKR